ncbi:MAG TPA: NAD+ synthase [Bacteroidales bacterium]
MKIALAQLNYVIGDFEHNVSKIISQINLAKLQGADLVIFAELSVSGYPPRDFLEFDDFIERSYQSIDKIAAECKGIGAIVGAPFRNPSAKGKNLFNSAWLLADGKVQAVTHKSLLPNYDVFDEYRYFEPNRSVVPVTYRGLSIALTICEDIWDVGDDPLYIAAPMDELSRQHPDLMINIAASPFNYLQPQLRDEVMRSNALRYGVPLIYVNQVGGQTELIFDGGSMAVDSNGIIRCTMARFAEESKIIELIKKVEKWTIAESLNPESRNYEDKISLIHDALVLGIGDYFRKMGFQKAILGLSGGIDSAVTLAIAAKALGPENLKAVMLPSAFSSVHSIDDAEMLARNLGVKCDKIAITNAYEQFTTSLHPFFGDLPFSVAEENIQARVRAVFLMALANKFGYILLNTSNKSEAAVGYGTLYGDMCGGLSVLGDVYKTDIFALAHYINREKELIPANTITKPPSAELRPNQKDSDSLPDYKVLDRILFQYIEMRKGPNELIGMGFEKETVARIMRLVNTNEWKRYQSPPTLRVSPKAFGMGRRMPIVGKYLS